jgi:mannosyltransferase
MGLGRHTHHSASVLAQSPPSQTPPNGTRTTQHVLVSIALITLWLAALGTFAAGTFASLNNLYFNPAYFRDDYRGIARYVEGLARPGDALITIAPNQVEAFGYYHRGGAPVYPLPETRPLDPAATEARLAALAAKHTRLFVLYWGDEQADPQHRVEQWLNTHTFKADERWYGQVRVATYASAAPAAAPSTLSGARFGQHVTLAGYSRPAGPLAPGDILQVTLFWQTDAPLPERYKVFVHLYADPNLPPVAQQDGEPGGGLRPTSTWPAGPAIADNHGVLIPSDLPPGNYEVSIGLYELFTGQRLPVILDDSPAGDRLSLGTLTIR